MKKAQLQRLIKQYLLDFGFGYIKGNDYAINANDGKTKIIIRIPDGKKGFTIGAQFADFGSFDGILTNSKMLQYDFAYELAYASVTEYSEDNVTESTRKVIAAYEPYIRFGAEEIRKRIDEWTFGDLDESERDSVQRYLGLKGIDPYSDEYQLEKASYLRKNGGAIFIDSEEYNAHKEFYDRYEKLDAKITVNEADGYIGIHFKPERKWYQK